MKGTHHQGAHHIVSPIVYIKTLVVLFILMAATVGASFWVAPNLHLGPITIEGSYINNAIAMAIAIIKGTLVILFFMGVKKSSDLVKFWAMLGFVWFTLIFIILNDYGTRRFEPVQSWTQADPGSGMQRALDGPMAPHPTTVERTRP